MNEKEPIKVKLTTVILSFVILILIFVIIGMYAYYHKSNTNNNAISDNSIKTKSSEVIQNDNRMETTNAENSQNNNPSTNATQTTINTNDEQIAKLYKYIPAQDLNLIEKNAYQNQKITADNISSEYLLKNAFKNLEIKDSDKKAYGDWYKFDAKLLQAKVKEMYGKNIENREFNIDAGEGCGYENGEYLYSVGGGSSEESRNIRKIQKAYKEGENICIEDKYLYLEIKDSEEDTEAKLYSSSDATKLVANLNNTQELYSMNKEQSNENIINQYGSQMSTYKHTFKKANDGSYYWYSTEPVK